MWCFILPQSRSVMQCKWNVYLQQRVFCPEEKSIVILWCIFLMIFHVSLWQNYWGNAKQPIGLWNWPSDKRPFVSHLFIILDGENVCNKLILSCITFFPQTWYLFPRKRKFIPIPFHVWLPIFTHHIFIGDHAKVKWSSLILPPWQPLYLVFWSSPTKW